MRTWRPLRVGDGLTRRSSLVNAFPYWQGQDIFNATATLFDDVMQALVRIQSVTGSFDGVEVQVGETGTVSAYEM